MTVAAELTRDGSFEDTIENSPQNNVIFGIDVRPSYDDEIDDPRKNPEQDNKEAALKMAEFSKEKIDQMLEREVQPAGFKFNYGSWRQLDNFEGFHGQEALKEVINYLNEKTDSFVILDAKDGDIGPTARGYANSDLNSWPVDAVTSFTDMGEDSYDEFFEAGDDLGKGVFCLTRTSNPSAERTQNHFAVAPGEVQERVNRMLESEGEVDPNDVFDRYYEWTAEEMARKAKEHEPGTVGSVVGATTLDELQEIIEIYQENDVEPPLLLPGVGDQGASAEDVYRVVVEGMGYPEDKMFINSSSGITYRYAKDEHEKITREWHAEVSIYHLEGLIEETAGA